MKDIRFGDVATFKRLTDNLNRFRSGARNTKLKEDLLTIIEHNENIISNISDLESDLEDDMSIAKSLFEVKDAIRKSNEIIGKIYN